MICIYFVDDDPLSLKFRRAGIRNMRRRLRSSFGETYGLRIRLHAPKEGQTP